MFDRAYPQDQKDHPLRRPALGVTELEDRVVPTLLGQQLFPSDNAWNQNISNAPVAPNSPAIIANIGATTRVHPDWGSTNNNLYPQQQMYGIPVNIVHGNGPNVVKTNVVIDNYPGESDVVPVPLPTTYQPVIEGDLPAGPNTAGPGYNSGQRGDSHLIIWDEDNNVAYELFGASRPADPNLFPNTSGVELSNPGGWHAAQETVWDMKTNEFRTIGFTSADGAGLSILAGLARPDEGLPPSQGGQGAINHALRVTLSKSQLAGAWTYPASHLMNGPTLTTNRIPAGGRLRLMNTPAINTLINQMGPEAQIVARAMQQYGLIVADIGSPMFITGMDGLTDHVDGPNGPDLTWDASDIFASGPSQRGLGVLTAGDFEVVDLAPVVTGLSAANGSAGTTITITGKNFSGAGGRLAVLFGTTPSPTVTVVDDAHVTAVVPAGSGTVAVTVRSGINAASTGDPNYTETIASGYQHSTLFGYGVSATTPADQFTYGLPVSGSLSAAGFATSSSRAPPTCSPSQSRTLRAVRSAA